uniref:Uncharacterized protein n=1 Tax=Meloidogyne enterolobii TaxID=390850 RepID=A0A6V7U957_MELEN|nr:unnamed protein product [Meloidogyne enterolobii]
MPNPTVKIEKMEVEEPEISATTENTMSLGIEVEKKESEVNSEIGDISGELSSPFDDPVSRTRCLIQFIRLRNQRAEAELAQQNALKKQKMDAQATLQNARNELAQARSEQLHWERKFNNLNHERHDVLNKLKALHQKEIERKRHKEEAERQRQILAAAAEEQQRLAAAAAAAAAQQQQQQTDAYFQLKQLQQYLNSLIASAGPTGTPHGQTSSSPSTSLSGSQQQRQPSLEQLLLSAVSTSTASGGVGIAEEQQRLATSLLASAVQQQQQQLSRVTQQQQQFTPSIPYGQPTQQQTIAIQQQQELQNAVAKLLGQNFPGSSTPTSQTILQQSTPNLQNFQQNLQPSPSPNYAALLQQQQQFEQLQSQLASAIAAQQQQQRIPNAALSVNIQTALAAAASVGNNELLHSPSNPQSANQLTAAQQQQLQSLPPELLYQAALLAAAQLGGNPTVTLPSNQMTTNMLSHQIQHSQQQQHHQPRTK